MIHVVGLDPSLTGFGVARYRIPEEGTGDPTVALAHFGRAGERGGESLAMRRERLRTLAAQVYAFALVGYDPATDRTPVFIIESPTYASNVSGSAHDRAGAWWILLNILFKVGIVVEVPIFAVKQYATGRGRHSKAEGKSPMIAAANRMFGQWFPTVVDDNEADAAIIGAMAARQIGFAVEASAQRCDPGALGAVTWPPTLREFYTLRLPVASAAGETE